MFNLQKIKTFVKKIYKHNNKNQMWDKSKNKYLANATNNGQPFQTCSQLPENQM